jgi:hypothetical protein
MELSASAPKALFQVLRLPLAGPIEGISLQQLQQHFDWAAVPVTVQRK